MKELQKEKVRNRIIFAFVVMVLAMAFQYPKLAGALSPLGHQLHEMRMDALGVKDFKHPSNTMEANRLAISERSDPILAYQQYQACDTCPVPLFISFNHRGDYTIRIMNIVPKYQHGMKLPAGKYKVEIRRHFEDGGTLYGKTSINLTPENNIFVYGRDIATRLVIYDKEFN
jgi:hypothetical protein